MARNENPPFELGQTGAGIGAATVDASTFFQLLGMEWNFGDKEDPDALGPVDVASTGRESNMDNVWRLVRNTLPSSLLAEPAFLVILDAKGENIVGYTSDIGDLRVAAVDRHLPAAGCPQNDTCWVQVEGYAHVKSIIAGTATIAADSRVVPATAGASNNTTGGRVAPAVFTGATATLAENILGVIGTNVTAITADNTDTIIAILMGPKKF